MKIVIKEIGEEGLTLNGCISVEGYDLPLHEYEGWKQIAYSLHASIIGDECLVTGVLSTNMKAACSRCLEMLPMHIEVKDFQHSYRITGEESIDLTVEIREDILLALPFTYRCELSEEGRCPITGVTYSGDKPEASLNQDVWKALDHWKKKE